jgi:hypothetical protein
MTNIVTVNVSQTNAPAPSTLQRTGAFISQGGTTTTQGTLTLLTGPTTLTGILKAALANSTLTWSANVATVTTAAPHGFTTSDTLSLVIAGVTPSAYNGTYLCTILNTTQFTYPLLTNPGGSASVVGTYAPVSVAELAQMNTTFWAQGSALSVYVLELGPGNPTDGVTYLTTWIGASAQFVYAYLTPRLWDNVSAVLTFYATFESTTSKTYFQQTTTTGTENNYPAAMKCVLATVEAPSLPGGEFSAAADFWVTLNYNPTSTNKVTPNAFAFLSGVTPYPTVGNAATLATLKSHFTNVVGTGAEGGLSNTIELYGTTKDGNDFTYWYSVDWVQINLDLQVSNAVINGSNNPTNPLYYNQNGINSIQRVASTVMANGVSFGLVLGQVVSTQLTAAQLAAALQAGTYAGLTLVNAIPFVSYGTTNPNDYKTGTYSGLTVVYVPARGFTSIVFNVNVTQFTAP